MDQHDTDEYYTPVAMYGSLRVKPSRIARSSQSGPESASSSGGGEAAHSSSSSTFRDSFGTVASTHSPPPESPREDAIRVIVRVRPLSAAEAAGAPPALTVVGANSVVLAEPGRLEPYAVALDYVLDENASQEATYAAAGSAMVDHCMAGFNSSIFAYGQTGSGKTHTMLGDVRRGADGALTRACGLTPRVFEALFAAITQREQAQRGAAKRYSVKCSFLEIYNEEVTDLLSPGAAGLHIRDGDLKRGVYVQGLSETEVLNADDVLTLIARGSENRRIAATRMNERSSRSHSVFTATIECHERTPTGAIRVRYAKMNLIDLAGSERVGRSGVVGQALAEAKSINMSLAVLGRVISALVERQRQRRPAPVHVPYRDSRLTFLLQESLGGNAKTLIVANVTPAADSAAETYSTLQFASGAKKIKCQAVVNEDATGDARALAAEIVRLQALVEDKNSETLSLRQQLEATRELFDQNNAAITAMRAEEGILRREASAARATAERLAEEAMQLRGDNAVLNAALNAEGIERERLTEELALSKAAAEAAEARSASAAAAGVELATLREELAAARASAAEVTAEVAEVRAGRAVADAMLEEARAEVRRAQREAREDGAAAAAREEGLKREVEALRGRTAELVEEATRLAKELNGEHSSLNKYKRMVGEIGRLIDWAQASGAGSSSAAAAAAAGAVARSGISGAPKPSPAALAALRVARMSLGGGGGLAVTPLADATNARCYGGNGGRYSAASSMKSASRLSSLQPSPVRPAAH